jgi:hypothetical protein
MHESAPISAPRLILAPHLQPLKETRKARLKSSRARPRNCLGATGAAKEQEEDRGAQDGRHRPHRKLCAQPNPLSQEV